MTKKRSGPITAAEAMKQLEADPEYHKWVKKRDRELAEREAILTEAEQPILRDLKQIGFDVKTVWDLWRYENYDSAIPLLLKHLQLDYPDRSREGIARRLAIPAARPHWDFLVDEYRKCSDEKNRGTKDGLAIVLSEIYDNKVIPDLIKLIKEPENGESRIMLLKALRKSKLPEAQNTLQELADDPVFSREIGSWKEFKTKA